jgi:hypothetical protein
MEQTAQYIGVVQAVSQTLQDYINNTADDISADEIGAFLLGIAGVNDDALNFLLGDSTGTASLNSTEATAINNAVALPPAAGASTTPASSGNLTSTKKQNIAEAIARRIANNKYDLLQTMVRQGVLRLYVDNGIIETRLTFTTYGQSVSSSSRTNRKRLEANSASGFGAAGGFGGVIGSTVNGFGAAGGFGKSSSSLAVSTSQASQRDVTGSRVQIFGRVRLNFKTDLLPLAGPGT